MLSCQTGRADRSKWFPDRPVVCGRVQQLRQHGKVVNRVDVKVRFEQLAGDAAHFDAFESLSQHTIAAPINPVEKVLREFGSCDN